jgi:hypothetical protein
MHALKLAVGCAWIVFWIYWIASASSSKERGTEVDLPHSARAQPCPQPEPADHDRIARCYRFHCASRP